MQKKTNSILMAITLLAALVTVSSCAKPHANQRVASAQQPQVDDTTLDADEDIDLAPTAPDEKLKTTDATYEPTPKSIVTPQVTLQLGKVKMINVKLKYDAKKRKFSVKGTAIILDENQKEVAESDFSLQAVHDADTAKFVLTPVITAKTNSDEKPVVTANVTCADLNPDDSINCSKNSFIDFYIGYKKQIYTDQLETVSKTPATVKPVAPVKPVTDTPSDVDVAEVPADTNPDDSVPGTGLQIEKEDDSVLGRFEGSSQTTDFSKQFDADDAIQSIIKPAPVIVPDVTKPAPAQPTPVVPAPSAPAPTTPATTPAKPANPPATTPVVTTPAAPATQPTKPATPTTPTEPAKPEPIKPSQPSTPPSATTTNDTLSLIALKQVSTTTAALLDGTIRFVDQALGYADSGKLRNATSVLDKQKAMKENSFFEVAFPTRSMYFATFEMAEMIARLGNKLNSSFHKKLFVSDISKMKGGYASPHASHQIGMDADLGYPATDDSKFPRVAVGGSLDAKKYSAAKTLELFKYAFQQKDIQVARIFVDQKIINDLCKYAKSSGEFNAENKNFIRNVFSNIQHVDGHGDHFHLRLKCGPGQSTCRDRIYRVMNQCG